MKKFEDLLAQVTKHMVNPPENLAELAERPVDMAAEERRVQREWKEAKTDVLLRRIPPKFSKAIPRNEKTLAWLDDYADGGRRNLILSGPVQTGKTWEACAVAIRLLRRFIPVTIVEVPDLMDELRPGGDDAGAGLAPYKATPVLVLDDLGAEKSSEWTAQQLYAIVNSRYKNLLPTVVTTNLGGAEFVERYDSRLTRRLTEDAITVRLTERITPGR